VERDDVFDAGYPADQNVIFSIVFHRGRIAFVA
jgi:hypothetical protein